MGKIHLAAFSESQAANGLTLFAPVTDQLAGQISGDDLRLTNKHSIGAVYGVGANLARLQFDAPSLQAKRALPEFRPLDAAAEPSSDGPFHDMLRSPLALDQGETLNVRMDNGNTAERDTALIWLVDGPVEPVSLDGAIPIRATGTTTLSAAAWTNVPLTLDRALKAGTYELLHMRAESAGAIAARVVGKNGEDPKHRPGVLAYDAAGDVEPYPPGAFGLLATFTHDNLPDVEFFSVSADTAETVWLYIRKVG